MTAVHRSRVRVSAGRRALAAALAAATFGAAHAANEAETLIPADVPPPAVDWNGAVDFDALRLAWGRRLDYRQHCEASLPTKAWTEATTAARHQQAYDIARQWLEQCPVAERVHLWAASSAEALGDAEKAKLHVRWFVGLVDSVLKTGDGKTAKTAWVTISVPEEYAVLTRLRLKATTQALVNAPEGMVDALTAVPADGSAGEPATVYFRPALHFARLMHDIQSRSPASSSAK